MSDALDGYDAYGLAASELSTPMLIAGRWPFHAAKQRYIVDDVVAKLALDGRQQLLEIGCGVGTLLNGLAAHVSRAVGIDHPSCIGKYRSLHVPPNVELIAGRWPEVRADGPIDRILAYSVVHYLADADMARAFIDAAVQALGPGGVLMIGDIPNLDALRRLRDSPGGRAVQEQYQAQQEPYRQDAEVMASMSIFARMQTPELFLTDAFVLALLQRYRRDGLHAYVLPQPESLPFCYSREDLVIRKPA